MSIDALRLGWLRSGLHRGQREERQVGQLHAVGGEERALGLLAQLRQARHVHLDDGGELRGGLQRFHHALGDRHPEPRELLGAPAQRARNGLLRGRFRLRRSGCRRLLLDRLLFGGLRGRVEYVLLADAPAHAGACDRRQIDAVLAGELADERGDIAVAAVGGALARTTPRLRRRRDGLRRWSRGCEGAGAVGAGGAAAGAAGWWRRRAVEARAVQRRAARVPLVGSARPAAPGRRRARRSARAVRRPPRFRPPGP
jgi:hypothetical protein